MWLVRAALGNFHAVVVLVLFVVVLGAVALMGISVDILPSFKAPAVQVLTYFNGMPAESTERIITDRIERWVNQSPGIRHVESRPVTGVSVVKLYFRDDTDPTAALTMTNSLALSAMPALPPNTLPPVVLPFDPAGTLPLGIITVSNPTMSEAEVKDLARVQVRNALGRIERQDLIGRAGVASARLTRQLLLDPAVTLVPADTDPVPFDLVPTDAAVE